MAQLKLLIVCVAAGFCLAALGITVIAVVAIALEDDEVTEPSAGRDAVFQDLMEVTAMHNQFATEGLMAPADIVAAIAPRNNGDNLHNLAIPGEDEGMPIADGGNFGDHDLRPAADRARVGPSVLGDQQAGYRVTV